MSLPVAPTTQSASELLGIPASDLLIARWDPTVSPDGAYNVWPDCEPFAPGKGFWLRVLSDVGTMITGVKPAEDQRILVPLELGWNMIGSPREFAVAASDLKVQIGTEAPVSLAEAVSSRIVQTGIYAYDASEGYVLADTLQPFAGYWIRVLNRTGCRLAFEPLSDATSAGVRTTAAAASPSWRVCLQVSSGSLHSSSAYFGGAAGASSATDPSYDTQAPPAFGDAVTARFVRTESGAEAEYLTDVRSEAGVGESFEVQVASTLSGAPVRVAWPDLSELPAQVRPFLVDLATGKRLAMRTTTAYRLAASNGPVSRRLRIELSPAATGALTVSGMASSGGSAALTVSYQLSAAATVEARVLNIAGRVIRNVVANRLDGAGPNAVTWNLHDVAGKPVPRGTYLMELQARDETGQLVRTVTPLRVSR
jgi:hypothetical protein